MAEGDPNKSWWYTVPGILTGIAAILTAIAGLVVAINQTNWLSRPKTGATKPGTEIATGTAPGTAAAKPQQPSFIGTPPDSAATDEPSSNAAIVTLPTMRDYTMGEVVFTLLDASLTPRNSESSTLTIRMRLLNNGRYDVNFWDSEFRLLVDGIPRAPNSGLNMVVAGNAANEGDVTFILQKSVTHPQLRILFADEKTDIPLTLVHAG